MATSPADSGIFRRAETSRGASDFETLPQVESVPQSKNLNNNSDGKPKRPVNILFVISITLFSVGLILCIVAGILTQYVWIHKRGGESKEPSLEKMHFPCKSKHTAEALKKWAQDFNDIRAKNAQAEGKIPRVDDEVCQTFEKFPGLYNDHIEEGKIEGGKIEIFKIYYWVFFSHFFFIMAACLMFFVILFVIDEHLMILKGGDAFDCLNKCSLISSLLCSVMAVVACVLLTAGLSQVHPEFLKNILTETCKYEISSMTYAALVPGAVAAVFFLIGAPMSFVMYRD